MHGQSCPWIYRKGSRYPVACSDAGFYLYAQFVSGFRGIGATLLHQLLVETLYITFYITSMLSFKTICYASFNYSQANSHSYSNLSI